MNIALLTCQKLPDLNVPDQLLIPALARHGIIAKAVVWDDPSVDWLNFDLLIFRNTWDYYEKETAFNSWLHKIEKLRIKTLNSIAVIKQNKHKFYLRALENQGIPILPTVFVEKTNHLNLKKIIPPHWEKIVIKPAFSAGSYLTEVFNFSEMEFINQKYKNFAVEKEFLLQEFVPQIQTHGETSFIFFNKKFSHAVNKKPKEGDFRVQVQFGGNYSVFHPEAQLIQQAQKIIDTYSKQLLYARVDGIIIENSIHLMEIECIEPDLYFNLCPEALERFVDSILELIK